MYIRLGREETREAGLVRLSQEGQGSRWVSREVLRLEGVRQGVTGMPLQIVILS